MSTFFQPKTPHMETQSQLAIKDCPNNPKAERVVVGTTCFPEQGNCVVPCLLWLNFRARPLRRDPNGPQTMQDVLTCVQATQATHICCGPKGDLSRARKVEPRRPWARWVQGSVLCGEPRRQHVAPASNPASSRPNRRNEHSQVLRS